MIQSWCAICISSILFLFTRVSLVRIKHDVLLRLPVYPQLNFDHLSNPGDRLESRRGGDTNKLSMLATT
ncbi:hypothetical protein P691DRAFT_73092 [Macrolepiota fuliginosa MF-IS2]|uniref:Uncharacterized protein n=1 Tax=Macrolepiota fuliginosa MF-IS2 TaxID=1400762 RepID=A0A9P6BWG5_9AGAR|nr:hypothetical protein P691DRAFT_73092 [Macrolepiota fuliginosa MF-IS2]